MTDLLQWAMLIFLAAGAVAMFAIAADILSRCPELQNRIEMLKEELTKYHNQHRCGCGDQNEAAAQTMSALKSFWRRASRPYE